MHLRILYCTSEFKSFTLVFLFGYRLLHMCGMDCTSSYFTCVSSSGGSGGETVPQSVCSSFVSSVAAAGGQHVEQVVARVEWLPDNVCGESWQCDPELSALSCDLLPAALRASSILRCDALHRRTPETSLPVWTSVTSSQTWEISFSWNWFTYYLRLLHVSPPHWLYL